MIAGRGSRASPEGELHMAYRTVDAGRGIEWIKQIFALIAANPVAFLVMGLIVGVIAIIPLIGTLAVLVLLPTFYAGIAYAAREQDQGRQADIKHLFQGFNEPGRIGPLVTLCLPQVAAGVLFFILALIFVGGAILGGGLGADANPAAIFGAMGFGFVILLLVGLVVTIAVYMAVLFAIPKVMFDGEAAFPAMKESFSAALANLVPIIVFGLVVGIAFMILAALIGWIPILGMIVLFSLIYAFIGVSHYVIWRDVYQPADTGLPPPPPA
jgi:hypothetical protein